MLLQSEESFAKIEMLTNFLTTYIFGTVHYVNEIPDGGEIILQKSVSVKRNETPESLQQKVMRQAEWIILPKATEQVCAEIVSLRKENKK